MPLSIADPHPTGQVNPAIARVWAALPAANAWDAAPLVIITQGFWVARLYFAYRRAAANGSLDYYYDLSPYSADAGASASGQAWFHGTLYAPDTLVQCQIAHSRAQQEYITYCSTSANIETFIGPTVHLGGCIERLRVFCREGLMKAAPGTAEVIALLYVEG